MNPDYKEIGKNIRLMRIRHGISQSELAQRLDVWLNDGRYGFIFLPVQYWYCSLPAASCARYLCRS